MEILSLTTLANYSIQRKTFEGRPHVVVPVVLLVEGVHHGSGGATFYSSDELSSYPSSWNGIPVPVLHPTDNDGSPVSCNSPEIIEQTTIGRLFNVVYNHPKLVGEVWIDELKAQKVAPNVLKDLIACKIIEVSTGLFSDREEVSGEWEGETYEAVIKNIRPDHLALLPGQTGACSVKDGCGIRANKGECSMKITDLFESETKELISNLVVNKKPSFEETRRAIQRKMDELDVRPMVEGGSYMLHYVLETFSDNFIFSVESNGSNKMYRRNYSISSDGNVLMGTELTEVREETRYIPVSNAEGENKKEETNMADVKKCCPKKVQELIDNKATAFTAEDKEWLEALTAEQLEKISAVEEVKEVEEVKPTDEEIKANAKKDADVAAGLALLAEKKATLIGSIVANKKNVFEKDELETKEIVELEKISALSKVDDYSGSGSASSESHVAQEVLDLPVMNFNKKEK